MELGYWNCQARQEVSIYVLNYLGKEFTMYSPTTYPEWLQKKQKMETEGFFSPTLPYLIDGDYKISESLAIPVYLLNKYDKSEMLGKTPEDIGRVRQLVGILEDQFLDLASMYRSEEYKKLYDEKLQILKTRLQRISKLLGDKEYLMGYLTLADFELHFVMKNYVKTCGILKVEDEFQKYDNLKKHSETIYNLPELKKFFEERKNKPLPFYPLSRSKIPTEQQLTYLNL